jgi:hypothetical protein
VGSLERRLERLEASKARASQGEAGTPRYLDRYFKALENLRRKEAGLAKLPLPYTKEDRSDDEDTLRVTIPTYRALPGWQTGEAAAFLDSWERDLEAKLYRGEMPM